MDWDFHNSLNELLDEGLRNGTAGWGTTRTGYPDPPRGLPWQNPKDFSDAVDRVKRLQDPCSFMDNCYACEDKQGVKMRPDFGGIRLCQKCYDEDAVAFGIRHCRWCGDKLMSIETDECLECTQEHTETAQLLKSMAVFDRPAVAKRVCQECGTAEVNPDAAVCILCLRDGRTPTVQNLTELWQRPDWVETMDKHWRAVEYGDLGFDWGWFGRFGRGLAYGWILITAEQTIPWAGKLYHLIRKSVDRNYREEYQ